MPLFRCPWHALRNAQGGDKPGWFQVNTMAVSHPRQPESGFGAQSLGSALFHPSCSQYGSGCRMGRTQVSWSGLACWKSPSFSLGAESGDASGEGVFCAYFSSSHLHVYAFVSSKVEWGMLQRGCLLFVP